MNRICGFSATRRALLQGTAALGVACGTGLVPRPAVARGLKVGEPAPPAVLVTLTGERIATRDLLGRVVILTFWATYCVPCREELPLLSAYAAQHAAAGLTVLGFCLDDADQVTAVRNVAATLSFPVGFLMEDSAPGYGRIWRMPANFTIGRDGRLAENGWKLKDSSWTRERLDRVIGPLLEKS
jgi:thiol-disulfide isomerase/thioredoxin